MAKITTSAFSTLNCAQKYYRLIHIMLSGLILFSLPCAAMQTDPAAVKAARPMTSQHTDLSYSVKFGKRKAGTIQTKIDQNANVYSLESKTKSRGIASIFLGGEITDRCQFSLNSEQQVIGNTYSSKQKGRSRYGGAASYDWDKQRIDFRDTPPVDIPEGYLLDNCNIYAAVAISNIKYFQEMDIHAVDVNESRYRSYVFESLEREAIESEFGPLDTRKLTLVRDNNADRKLIFWLADRFPLSPAKIVDQRKKRRVEFKLMSYSEAIEKTD